MKRLSLAELSAKAGTAVIKNIEAIKGGDGELGIEIPPPPIKPMPCDNA